MIKCNVVFVSLLMIVGCESVDHSSPQASQTIDKSSVKVKPCQLSPPIIDRDKLIAMLIKSGDIKASDSKDTQYKKLDAYIQQKNDRGMPCKK
ncbi:hypothetical protein ACMAZF_10185 [Psychrobium sp. nBUS_13]|uniref:hypothetical protein n=1 Tax=Psychrobium sp. nBUS_13 TaxID=3395319 RepID=UPI003EB963AD